LREAFVDADKLPVTAALKLERLRTAATDAQALMFATNHARDVADKKLGLAVNRRDSAGDTKATEAADVIVKAIEAEVSRLQAEAVRRRGRHGAVAGLAANLDAWIRQQPAHAVFELAEVPPLAVPADDGFAAALERVRAERDQREAELRRLQSAPLPLSELKVAARGLVEDLSRRGRPAIDLRQGLEVKWRTREASVAHMSGPDVAALLCWLFPNEMAAALDAAVTRAVPAAAPVPSEGRAERMDELAAEVLALERREERLIELATEAGMELLRRPHANPMAVLGVRVAQRAVRAA